LFERTVTGQGRSIEIPMFEAMTAFNLIEHQAGLVFDPPTGPSGYARTMSAHRRPHRTADGYLAVLMYTDRQWHRFFDLIGRSDLRDEPRFAAIRERTVHVDELYSLVADTLRTRSTRDWLTDLRAADIPCAPVTDVAALWDDDHLAATGFFERVDDAQLGGVVLARHVGPVDPDVARRNHLPYLGADAESVLADAGYSPSEIPAVVESLINFSANS
jgi:crotonobetainyl-CoA:carnitine CoA-transferase CaiB-like acyl-CoA transferase